jgi:hypothetical protein
MDGKPIPRAIVEFHPDNGEAKRMKDMKRTSMGVADEHGKFTMFYEEGIQGVAVGKCRIRLMLPPPFITPPEYTVVSTTFHEIAKGQQTIDIPLTSPPKR